MLNKDMRKQHYKNSFVHVYSIVLQRPDETNPMSQNEIKNK